MKCNTKNFIINGHIEVFPESNKIIFSQKKSVEVHVEPRIMKLLILLSSDPGRIYKRPELIEQIWDSKWIAEEGLTKAISELRKSLKDATLIKTNPKQGYTFVGEVREMLDSKKNSKIPHLKIPLTFEHSLIYLLVILVFTLFYIFTPFSEEIPSYKYSYLTEKKGLHLSPTISSNGQLVAYTERNDTDQKFTLILQSVPSKSIIFKSSDHYGDYESPVFSPNNKFLAFINKESGHVFLSTLDIKNHVIKNIYQMSDKANPQIDWSPDGQWLVFNDRDQNTNSYNLYMYNLDQGEVKQITNSGLNEINPSFSSDGSKIAFIQKENVNIRANINVLDLKSGHSKVIKKIPYGVYDLDWSEDGKSILYTSSDGFDTFIHKLSLSDRSITQISNQNFYQLSINSNQNQLVASSYSSDDNIWMKRLSSDSSMMKPVVNSNRYELKGVISPDGIKMAYVSDISGSFQVWEFDFETKSSRQLTRIEGRNIYDKLSWSPNGKHILTSVKNADFNQILLISPDSNNSEVVINDQFVNQFPEFNSNSTFHFISNRSGSNELWIFDLAEKKLNKLSNISHDLAYAKLNPTDSSVYFTQVGLEGLWKSKISGGTATKILCPITKRDYDSWELFEDGIYYIDRFSDPATVSYLDFESGEQKTLFHLPSNNHTYNTKISVSTDRSSIVFNQIDHFESDIVLLKKQKSI